MRTWLGGLFLLSLVMVKAEGADVSALVAQLKSPDSDVRRAAAKELGGLGSEAAPAATALAAALKDKDRFVRRNAAEALGAIGPDAKSAVPKLSLAVNDSTKEVQLAAVEALGNIGAVSTKALANAVKDLAKDQAVRVKAVQGLAKFGKEARGAVPTLTTLLKAKPKKKGKGKYLDDDDIRVDIATASSASIATTEDTAAIDALEVHPRRQSRRTKEAQARSRQRRLAQDHRRSAQDQEEKEEEHLSRFCWRMPRRGGRPRRGTRHTCGSSPDFSGIIPHRAAGRQGLALDHRDRGRLALGRAFP